MLQCVWFTSGSCCIPASDTSVVEGESQIQMGRFISFLQVNLGKTMIISVKYQYFSVGKCLVTVEKVRFTTPQSDILFLFFVSTSGAVLFCVSLF